MMSIESAFNAYLNGDIDGWDLQDVVEQHGFGGFTVTEDCKLIVHMAK